MGYKPGIACGASGALLFFSAGLLSLFVACSQLSCAGMNYAFASPIWTGVSTLAISLIGIYMSKTKSEQGCGAFFLTLSIISIFVTLACVSMTMVAGFAALLSEPFTYTSLSSTIVTPTTAKELDITTSFTLWMVMMGVAFILLILTCVTSWQYCCCQQPAEATTVIVYQQPGVAFAQQNVAFTNINTTTHVQQQVVPQVVQGHAPGVMQYAHQPYSPQNVGVTQPYPPYMGGGPPPPYSGPPPQPAPQATAPSYPQNASQRLEPPMATPTAPSLSQRSQAPKSAPQSSQQTHVPGSSSINDPSLYQSLILENQQTSSQNRRSDGSADLRITYGSSLAGASEQVDPNSDGGYEVPSRDSSGDYDEPEELPPQYDYVDLQRTPTITMTDSEYVNERIDRRPKAPDPRK